MSELRSDGFGTTESGQRAELYTFSNVNGLEISITNFGGRIVSIKAPDRKGQLADIVLGFDELAGYLRKNPYFGAIVGRYANRIANASFTLGDQKYQLQANDGPNCLHGGKPGFDGVLWSARADRSSDGGALELRYLSVDGECGFPGNLNATVTYRMKEQNELVIEFMATTDRATVLNLTNHSYFDLSGNQGRNKILDHVVTINADAFTPIDEHLVPTGELTQVEGTPFDFRAPRRIGDRIDQKNEQLKLSIGYDQNFVINGDPSSVRLAARAVDPQSGRTLEVLTTQPGMQFYTGNHLTGEVVGKGGAVYGFRSGFCLETQHFPDSPHHPNFPTTVLQPGEVFRSTTIFRFSVAAPAAGRDPR